jgi:hypothetical protein
MPDALDIEITDGGPAEIMLRGTVHRLAYPIHNVIVYKRQTGDSLFAKTSWSKVDLEEDPERWLACLWAGMHQEQPDHTWKAPFTLEELGGLVDFSNSNAITLAMVKAMISYLPKKKEGTSPNATAPAEEIRPAQSEANAPKSPTSGSEPGDDTALAAPSS